MLLITSPTENSNSFLLFNLLVIYTQTLNVPTSFGYNICKSVIKWFFVDSDHLLASFASIVVGWLIHGIEDPRGLQKITDVFFTRVIYHSPNIR